MDDMTYQGLINSGSAWRLEGSFGRAAMSALEAGYAILGTEGHRDYYGNYVPSRTEVKSGTKGSVLYANRLHGTRFTGKDFDSGRAVLILNDMYGTDEDE